MLRKSKFKHVIKELDYYTINEIIKKSHSENVMTYLGYFERKYDLTELDWVVAIQDSLLRGQEKVINYVFNKIGSTTTDRQKAIENVIGQMEDDTNLMSDDKLFKIQQIGKIKPKIYNKYSDEIIAIYSKNFRELIANEDIRHTDSLKWYIDKIISTPYGEEHSFRIIKDLYHACKDSLEKSGLLNKYIYEVASLAINGNKTVLFDKLLHDSDISKMVDLDRIIFSGVLSDEMMGYLEMNSFEIDYQRIFLLSSEVVSKGYWSYTPEMKANYQRFSEVCLEKMTPDEAVGMVEWLGRIEDPYVMSCVVDKISGVYSSEKHLPKLKDMVLDKIFQFGSKTSPTVYKELLRLDNKIFECNENYNPISKAIRVIPPNKVGKNRRILDLFLDNMHGTIPFEVVIEELISNCHLEYAIDKINGQDISFLNSRTEWSKFMSNDSIRMVEVSKNIGKFLTLLKSQGVDIKAAGLIKSFLRGANELFELPLYGVPINIAKLPTDIIQDLDDISKLLTTYVLRMREVSSNSVLTKQDTKTNKFIEEFFMPILGKLTVNQLDETVKLMEKHGLINTKVGIIYSESLLQHRVVGGQNGKIKVKI